MASSMQIHEKQEKPSPELIFETVNGFQRTASLKAAIELDVFTRIGEGAQTVEALAQSCGTSERGMRILCDYLAVIGFLSKSGNNYNHTLNSKTFLDRRSPQYMGSAVKLMLSVPATEGFNDLVGAVRKGGTVISQEGIVAPEHPIWVEFARAMAPLTILPAEIVAKLVGADSGEKWKVLDIAAGHGRYGLAIAKHNPNAQVVANDWRNVLAVAEENARAEGISNRFRTIPGSAFDVDFGSGYDLVLLPNLLHHFDPVTIGKLFSKINASLKPAGRLLIVEPIPDEDRVSPTNAVEFALLMLASTPGGDTYTFQEFRRMLESAGFAGSELHPLPPTFFRAIIARGK